jgi:hypothetical protein
MPHHFTRPEVVNRLAIKAYFETRKGVSRRQMAALFHVSLRTVHDAVHGRLEDMAAALETALEPRPSARQVTKRLGQIPSIAWKSIGTRKKAKLVPPEPDVVIPDEDSGVDLDPPRESWVEGRSDVVDPSDDPVPKKKTK